MGEDAVQQQERVRPDEDHEDGGHHGDRFLYPPDVENYQHHGENAGHLHLVGVIRLWDIAEQGIDAGGDGYRDGQHVVDQQRAAGYHPRVFPKHVRRHDVPPAAVREVFDDAGVGIGDDEHGEGREGAEREGEVGVTPQRAVRLLGTVGR